jgi:outer membrane protein OmpA-like peptidoglycan-associated protein
MHLRALGALAVFCASLPAWGQAPEVDLSLLRPATGSDGTVGVEGARPMPEGVDPVELQILIDAAWHPVRDPQGHVDQRTGMWLGLQGRLDPRLSLSVQIPLTLREDGDLSGLGGPSSLGAGIGDVRVGARYALFSSPDTAAAIQLNTELATSQQQALTGDARLDVEALGSVSRRWAERFEALGNLYVRFRPPRDFGAAKLGNMIGARGALVYTVDYPWRAFGELEAATSLRDLSVLSAPIEWRVGLRTCLFARVAIDLAFGTRLDGALGAPDFRSILSARYAPAACQPLQAAPDTAKVLAQMEAARRVKEKKAEEEAARNATREALRDALALAEKQAEDCACELRKSEEKDSDGDGIPDIIDNCPFEKGPVINHGCPMTKKQLVALREDRIDILEKVQFGFGTARIEKRSFKVLDQVASILRTHPGLARVQVEGHTDSTGNAKKNTVLSQKRADAVVKYLVAHGVEKERLVGLGLGPTRPLAPNVTATGRAANRRVEFRVLERRAAPERTEAPKP